MDAIPYPGLRPFTHNESSIFFGREQHTQLALEKLFQTRFVAVIGPSGCGKSSLVRAGMLPAFQDGSASDPYSHWWVGTMRPGADPLRNLARTLLRESLLEADHPETFEEETGVNEIVLPFLRRGPSGLLELLREEPLPSQTRFLLFIEHFEDIFRSSRQGARDDAAAFVALVLASVQQDEFPIYVITTMRTDVIGECTAFRDLAEAMEAGQYFVSPLTRKQQEMSITEPARLFGGSVAPDLVDLLLDEMEQRPHQLPLLQHCLMRMWLRAKFRSGVSGEESSEANQPIMTLEDYAAVGGLEHALSNHADEVLQELNTTQQHVAERMFRRLGDRRANWRDMAGAARIHEIASIAGVPVSEVIDIIEVFRRPEHCFLTPPAGVPLHADTIVALSHEALMGQWQQLKQWIEQEAKSAATYRRLAQTARLWEQGKASLWRSPDIENGLAWYEQERPTETWARRYNRDFALAIKFLKASAGKKRRGRLLGFGLVIAGFIVVASLIAWSFWGGRQGIRIEPTAVENDSTAAFHLRQVIMKDMQGLTIAPVNQRFLVRPRESVTLTVDIENPSNRPFRLEYESLLDDTAISDATYTVPNLPGNHDVVLVKAVDADTAEILDQEMIKIKIVTGVSTITQ